MTNGKDILNFIGQVPGFYIPSNVGPKILVLSPWCSELFLQENVAS